VVLVEVRQEVDPAAAGELVHGHQPFVHGCFADAPPPPRGFGEREGKWGREEEARAKNENASRLRLL
jgi:hypothetical protein